MVELRGEVCNGCRDDIWILDGDLEQSNGVAMVPL